jgi:hypothetical protein
MEKLDAGLFSTQRFSPVSVVVREYGRIEIPILSLEICLIHQMLRCVLGAPSPSDEGDKVE